MLKDIKAAIFDLDGTLIDSMWVWEKIDVDYLALKGHEMPSDLRDDIAHLSFQDTAVYFKNRFNLPDTLEEIRAEWNRMALQEYTFNIKLKPGAREFLALLKSNGIKIALATSNSSPLLDIALEGNDIVDSFDVITTTSEVPRGKDFPDIYLRCAEKMSVAPEHCIVFEDILPAVLSAKASGMKVIGILDKAASHQWEEIRNCADMTMENFIHLCNRP
ncbi:MAG: HAD family phosphatase [Bacillota bacterium]|nr:HAD family phosphatase [Bacillota bacterium]